MDQGEHVIPSFDELNQSLLTIDRSEAEFVFDVDLDELTVLFYGPDRPAFVHPENELLSFLLDVDTYEVVGLVFSQFTRDVVRRIPETADMVPRALVIKDDLLGGIEDFFGDDPTLGGRIGETAGAVGEHWESRSDAQSVRDVIRGIRGFG